MQKGGSTMIRRILIWVVALTLLGHINCMANGFSSAANHSKLPAYRFASVAPMHTSSTHERLLSNSSVPFETSTSSAAYRIYCISEVSTFGTHSLTTRDLGDVKTADETLGRNTPRRVISDGDEDLHPEYELNDPSLAPVGEVPLALLILLAAMVTYLRARKIKATKQTQTA